MRPDSRKLVFDVHQAGSAIAKVVGAGSYDQFRDDRILQLAVERLFEILGEAMSRMRKSDPETLERFPEHAAIIGLRNIIAHGYDRIDHRRLWDIGVTYVPPLVAIAESLLVARDPTDPNVEGS